MANDDKLGKQRDSDFAADQILDHRHSSRLHWSKRSVVAEAVI